VSARQRRSRNADDLPGICRGARIGLGIVRYLALLVLAVVFLTGLVWWVFFIGNSVVHLFRRR
jgi:hypothetical protein